MSTKGKIKVIKKGEVRNTEVPVLTEKKSKQESNNNGKITERDRSKRSGFRHGPVIGFQQALAHNLFYEIRIDTYADQILDDTPQALNFKLGFAF